MTIVNRKSLPAGVLAALIAIAPGAYAANGNAGTDDASFDQEQIESFAAAQAEVQEIQQEFTSKMQQGDQEQAAELQQEAQQKMTSAVENAGLEVQEYNRIAQASRDNQELTQRIQEAGE